MNKKATVIAKTDDLKNNEMKRISFGEEYDRFSSAFPRKAPADAAPMDFLHGFRNFGQKGNKPTSRQHSIEDLSELLQQYARETAGLKM